MSDFTYQAFDSIIRSFVALPELPLASPSSAAAIRIVEGKVARGETPTGCALLAGDVVLWWEGVAAFAVRPGRIVLDADPTCSAEIVRLPLLGPVLAVALQMAGLLVLHGNAVRIGDSAIVLVGEKGRGKSTFSAALLARGHRLLSDDVVALRRESCGTFSVLPGFPGMKLFPDTLARCGGLGPVAQRPLAPGADKLSLQLAAHHFSDEPARLATLCALERAAVPEFLPVTGPEAFRQLMAHSYCSRYGQTVFRGPAAVTHLHHCSALLATARFATLRRVDDFSQLESLVTLIEREAAATVELSMKAA